MPIVLIDDEATFEMGLYFYAGNQIAICRRLYAYQALTGGHPTNSSLVVDAWNTAGLHSALKGLIYNGASFVGTSIRLKPNPDALATDYRSLGNGVGTAGAVALPTQAAGLTTFTSNVMGKHGEGRNYWPFPAAADNELAGAPTASYVTRISNVAALLLAPLTVSGDPSGTGRVYPILQYTATTIGVPATMSGYRAHNAWATQRKRGAFGRVNQSPFV